MLLGMPHAETNKMSKPTMNGEKPSSQTLQHFGQYPLVVDATKMFQQNSLGAKTIGLYQNLYSTIAEPVFPYLQTPFSIVSPYVAQVDSLGNKSLDHVDTHFPAIKSIDVDYLKSSAFNIANFPFKIAGESRDYVTGTYQDEYTKTGGQGLATTGKAVVSTELRIVSEAMHAVADYIRPQKEKAQAEIDNLRNMGAEKLQKTKQAAQEKQGQAKQQVNSH
ncbi:MAG: hypothetical protein M1828_004390 [Chrysothrix sp. TS-e1954]|nr:MAG: hypothetical protein M1828_004390 [Chrysothrix sp. TS-e1954]